MTTQSSSAINHYSVLLHRKLLQRVVYTPCPHSVIPQSFFKPLQSGSSSHHSAESAPAQGSKDICVAKCNNCSSVLISFDPLAAFNGVINPFSLKHSALDFCYTTISESFQFLNYTIICDSLCACSVHASFWSVCLCATFYSLEDLRILSYAPDLM